MVRLLLRQSFPQTHHQQPPLLPRPSRPTCPITRNASRIIPTQPFPQSLEQLLYGPKKSIKLQTYGNSTLIQNRTTTQTLPVHGPAPHLPPGCLLPTHELLPLLQRAPQSDRIGRNSQEITNKISGGTATITTRPHHRVTTHRVLDGVRQRHPQRPRISRRHTPRRLAPLRPMTMIPNTHFHIVHT